MPGPGSKVYTSDPSTSSGFRAKVESNHLAWPTATLPLPNPPPPLLLTPVHAQGLI